jgi:hypothetical protein
LDTNTDIPSACVQRQVTESPLFHLWVGQLTRSPLSGSIFVPVVYTRLPLAPRMFSRTSGFGPDGWLRALEIVVGAPPTFITSSIFFREFALERSQPPHEFGGVLRFLLFVCLCGTSHTLAHPVFDRPFCASLQLHPLLRLPTRLV